MGQFFIWPWIQCQDAHLNWHTRPYSMYPVLQAKAAWIHDALGIQMGLDGP